MVEPDASGRRIAMGPVLTVVAVGVAAIVGGMLLFGSCQRSAVRDALDRSSAPLLVPREPWRADFDFTAPPGSTDLYQFRWNFSPGATDSVSGWQVGPGAEYDQPRLMEAPGQEEIDEVLRAADDRGCEVVEDGLRLCLYPAEFARDGVNAYLVHEVGGSTLVVTYLNIGGDRREFAPQSLDARYLAADFEAIPIDGDIDDFLVYIY